MYEMEQIILNKSIDEYKKILREKCSGKLYNPIYDELEFIFGHEKALTIEILFRNQYSNSGQAPNKIKEEKSKIRKAIDLLIEEGEIKTISKAF